MGEGVLLPALLRQAPEGGDTQARLVPGLVGRDGSGGGVGVLLPVLLLLPALGAVADAVAVHEPERAGGEIGVGAQELLDVEHGRVEQGVEAERRTGRPGGLADGLGAVDELLGQAVGEVEGEIAADDGDAGGGGHGARGRSLRRGEVAQERILPRLPLVVAEVAGREGEGVVAAGDDGDVVAPDNDRHDGDGGVRPSGRLGVALGQAGDIRPGLGEGHFDRALQALIDIEQEPAQGVRVVPLATDLLLEDCRIDAFLGVGELAHHAPDPIAVNVDDGDLRQGGRRPPRGLGASGPVLVGAGIGGGLEDCFQTAYRGPLLPGPLLSGPILILILVPRRRLPLLSQGVGGRLAR